MAEEFKFGKNDAGFDFEEPYVSPDTNDNDQTYEGVRGSDLVKSAAENEGNLQYTKEKAKDDYLRLLMPKYTRRVEVEDLNRNFWVIGQALNSVGKSIKNIGDEIINIYNIEKTRFEITKEKDRDGHDYSNYPHKIIFNEGVDGIRTPFMVKDYCYRSIEFENNSVKTEFENDSLWSRQLGGYNSPDTAYKIGSYGTLPILNFYKPRPDAIPVFTLVQTESSDTETHTSLTPVINKQYDINAEGSNFRGRAGVELWHNKGEGHGYHQGDILIYNTYEICPIQATEVDKQQNGQILAQSKIYTLQNPREKGGYDFDYFPEGQFIKVETGEVDEQGRKLYDTYVKVPDTMTTKNGFSFPKTYKWMQQPNNSTDWKSSNIKQLMLNFIDQKFILVGNENNHHWENLDAATYLDGPTVPQYQIVENGSMFRVLGDTDEDHEITDGSTTHPTINGKVFPDEYPGASIRDHDVVRNKSNGICFEWWNGAWRQIHNCDASYVNIFIWFPQKTSTLRSVYYWTLKWLIPPGLGEYD